MTSENCLALCRRKTCQSLNWIWNDVKKPHLVLIKIVCMLQSVGQVKSITLFLFLNFSMLQL